MKLLTSIVSNALEVVASVAKRLPDNKFFHCYTITTKGTTTPYLTRILFPRMFGWRVMLHHIHRSDMDRDLHNHPWKKAYSFLLTGSYIEERLAQDLLPFVIERIVRKIRWFNVLHKEDFHKIISIEGPLWTLFVAGNHQDTKGIEWGFLDEENRKLIPSEEYLAKTGAVRV